MSKQKEGAPIKVLGRAANIRLPKQGIAIAHTFVVPNPSSSAPVKLPPDLGKVYPGLKFPKTGITMFSGWPKATKGFANIYKYATSKNSIPVEVEVRIRAEGQPSDKVGLEAGQGTKAVSELERISLLYLLADAGRLVNSIWMEYALKKRIPDAGQFNFRYGFSDPRFVDDLFAHPQFSHLKIIVYRIRHEGEPLTLATIRNPEADVDSITAKTPADKPLRIQV